MGSYLKGQSVLSFSELALPALGENINHVKGDTITAIEKPANAGIVGKSQLHIFSDTGTFLIRLGNQKAQTSSAVDTSEDTVTFTGHDLETGEGPYQLTTAGTLPTGLSAATDYWVVAVDSDNLSFATSEANALAGTIVDITGAGSGTHTITGVFAGAAPASSVTNGSGNLILKENMSVALPAPSIISVKGADASAVLTYYWV